MTIFRMYAVKALVYDGDMKAASKLCKRLASCVTAAAAVALATGWACAGKGKKVWGEGGGGWRDVRWFGCMHDVEANLGVARDLNGCTGV